MKKFLMLLFCTCIATIPKTSFAAHNLARKIDNTGIRLNTERYAKLGNCVPTSNAPGQDCKPGEEEYVLFNTGTNNDCYHVDDGELGECADETVLCILFQSYSANDRGYEATNGCWIAHDGTDDYWNLEKRQIPDCHDKLPNSNWTRNSTDKTTVFVDISDSRNPAVIEVKKNDGTGETIPPKSLINYDPDKLCIAYICMNGTNDGYGNPDGSCTPPQPEDNNEDNGGGGGDGGNEPEPTPSEFPNPPAEPKDNSIPDLEDVVKPYLDLLID